MKELLKPQRKWTEKIMKEVGWELNYQEKEDRDLKMFVDHVERKDTGKSDYYL